MDEVMKQGGAAAGEEAAPAEFGEFEAEAMGAQGAVAPISVLNDLPLPVSIELGRTTMTVQEILALGRGSTIQLDRLAGEPIDVYVGDRHFAKGDVVVIDEQFGVRITRILSPGSGTESKD